MDKINSKTKSVLTKTFNGYGMTERVLDVIEAKSPTLVKMLNNFKGTFKVDTDNPNSGYENNTFHVFYKMGTITIGVAGGMSTRELILLLAHELGHAHGKFQDKGLHKFHSITKWVYGYNTPEDFGKAHVNNEAEAVFMKVR